MMIFAKHWAHLFNHDPGRLLPYFTVNRSLTTVNVVEIISTVAKIMPLISLFQIFHGISAVTGAIARARGKQVRLKTLSLQSISLIFLRGFSRLQGL